MKLTMTKFFIVMFVLAFAITFATTFATSLQGTYKQNEPIHLTQTCYESGAMCDACNISSITSITSIPIVENIAMTKGVSEFNYTFTQTSSLGTYYVNGYCVAGSDIQNWRYSINITPVGGPENNTTFFIILFVIALIFLLLAFIFHNYIFSILAGFVFLIAGMYGMIYGIGDITNLYSRMVSYIILGLGAIVTIISGLDLIGSVEGRNSTSEDDD
jgi:hypothetical protein